LDFSLVFDKNLTEILLSSSLGLRPDEVGQKGLKLLYLWRHSQKIQNPQFFFIADLKTCRVFWGLNSSLALSVPELMPVQRHLQTVGFRLNHTGSLGVKWPRPDIIEIK